MKDNFNNDVPETKEKPFSFNDLDLGLDFDLSFLDDIDESVLEEPAVEEKPAAPVKKEVPAKKAAPAKKPTAPQKDAPVKKAAPAAAAKKPAAKKQPVPADPELDSAPAKKAAPAKKKTSAAPKASTAPQQPAKKQKKGPRIGGVIFYTLYFMFILIFFIATYIGLNWLQGWLTDYELAQPTVKAEQVFQQIFSDPDWGALYESAGAQDSEFEGKEEYVNFMEAKMGDAALTYMETSAGLSGDKKYNVRLGDETVASFTLVDKNKVGNLDLSNLENLEDITDIPNWTLGKVEVFFQRQGSYLIEKLDGYTVTVNGVALDESYVIQKATTKAEDYLPEGTTGFVMETLEVTGLMEKPEVAVTNEDGAAVEVTYDDVTRTFTARTESNTMSEEEKEVALGAAKINCLWMIEEEKDRGQIAKYFDPSYKPYNDIVKTTELWMQNHNGYEFANESVTDYARYSDDIFSVRVSMDLIVTRTNGTTKTWNYAASLFFHKSESGKWLVFERTNIDVSQPVGKVRLTFMNGNTELTTGFFYTDAKEVITPVIAVPEGQVFTGWVTISTAEDGSTVYNLEFQPDPTTGNVAIPEGTVLKPMTLYAYFEDAATASAAAEPAPAETSPAETTPAETTAAAAAETTEGA